MGQVIKIEGANFSNNMIGTCRNVKLEFDPNYIHNQTVIINSDTAESALAESNTGLRLYNGNMSSNTNTVIGAYGCFFSVYDKWIEIDPEADSLNGLFSYLCSNNNPAVLYHGARCVAIKDINGEKTFASNNISLFNATNVLSIEKLIHYQKNLYANLNFAAALAIVKLNTKYLYNDGWRYIALSWQSYPSILGPITKTVNDEQIQVYHDTTKVSIDVPELYWVYES